MMTTPTSHPPSACPEARAKGMLTPHHWGYIDGEDPYRGPDGDPPTTDMTTTTTATTTGNHHLNIAALQARQNG